MIGILGLGYCALTMTDADDLPGGFPMPERLAELHSITLDVLSNCLDLFPAENPR